MLPPPPTSTLFPYTTLFRSPEGAPHASIFCSDVGDIRIGGMPPAEIAPHLPGGQRLAAPHLASASRGSSKALPPPPPRSEEHTSELQSHSDLVCRLLLEKKK